MKNKLFLSLLASSLLLTLSSAQAGTRDLVFEDDEEEVTAPAEAGEATLQKIAINTTVLLKRDGQESTVLPSSEFKSGDKVKLMFTSNVDGYVYWLAKGTSGEYSMLFPNAKAGMDNKITRNELYSVPTKGSFRFDDKPGTEELLCILSTEPMPDLDEAARNQFKDASALAQLEQNSAADEEEESSGTRDLVFEDEDDEETGVNTATQTAAVGEPFVVSYSLVHK